MLVILFNVITILGFKTNTYMSKQITNQAKFSPNGSTKYCFIFGNFLKNSPSPTLHTQWFYENQKDIIYLPYQIESEIHFHEAISSLLKCNNFHGANITMPFKNSILSLSNIKKSAFVSKSSVANTLFKNEANEWCLENTDIDGIKLSIETLIPENTKYNLILLGGGGTAASCSFYAQHINTFCQKVLCFTRNPAKTREKFPNLDANSNTTLLAESFLSEEKIQSLNSNFPTLIINTIPNQNINNNPLIKLLNFSLSKQIYFFDVVYTKTETFKLAEKMGIKCLNGELMFKEQARKSFYLWTGVYPRP